MPFQVVVGLRISPFIKVGQGNKVWEIVPQMPAKTLETGPAPIFRSLASRSVYTTVRNM